MCLYLAFTPNHLIKFQEIRSPAMHSGFRTYRWLNLEIWWGLSGNLFIIPGCSWGGQVNASRKSRMGVSGCLCTAKLRSNNTLTPLKDTNFMWCFCCCGVWYYFIMSWTFVILGMHGTASTLQCLLDLGDSQGLMEVGLCYLLWPGRWRCVKWQPLLQEIMLWHRAALGEREPGVGKLLPFKWRN